MKKKNIFLNCLKISVALIIVIFVALNYKRLVNLDLRAVVSGSSSFFITAIIIFAIYILKSVTFVVPAIMIYLSVGLMFETKTALIINAVGLALEVLITYFLGRFLSGEKVNEIINKNKAGQKLLSLYEGKKKFSFLIIVRALPVFPIDFTSLFLGSTRLSFIPYEIVSILAIMPRVALFTIFGEKVYDLFPKELLMKVIIVAMVCALIGYVIYRLVKTKNKKA